MTIGLFIVVVVFVHWIRQIKEMVISQQGIDTSENAGPLQEIEFWKERCDDLSGLTKQLEQPGIQRVIKILEAAKSSYLTLFYKLTKQMQARIKSMPVIEY